MNGALAGRVGRLSKNKPFFQAVLLHGDTKSGGQAWDFYGRLTQKFKGDFEFRHLMWGFSVLEDPETLRLAVASAADANLVILALPRSAELPASVKNWVKRWSWLACQCNAALVTLAGDCESAGVAEVHAYLRPILKSCRIDFFPHGAAISLPRRPE